LTLPLYARTCFSHRADVDRGGRVSGVAPGLSDRANGRPLSAWSAVPPVSRCQRSMLASTEDRIELDDTGAAAGPFRCYQRRAGAAEGVKDYATAVGAVADRVGNHGDRLDGRMEGKLALRCPVQCVLTDIVPDIGPVPAIAPERHVVDVRGRADLEH